jgi:hypothetical protein
MKQIKQGQFREGFYILSYLPSVSLSPESRASTSGDRLQDIRGFIRKIILTLGTIYAQMDLQRVTKLYCPRSSSPCRDGTVGLFTQGSNGRDIDSQASQGQDRRDTGRKSRRSAMRG